MSRDTILTDSEGDRYSYDNIRTLGFLVGHMSGLDAAVDFLKKRAVALFSNGKDEEAKTLRNLADEMKRELRPGMEANVDRHEKDHPACIDDEDEGA